MRRNLMIIGVLVLAIIAVLVSDTMAVYTKSFDFNLTLLLTKDPNRPIVESDFLKYEFNTQKTCDYNALNNDAISNSTARKCAQGSVTFDPEHYTMTVKNDAGAMKNYPVQYGNESYIVNARVTDISPHSLKNFGLIFNGSYTNIKYGISSVGYTLKFNENGDLVINEEGFANNITDDHSGDKIKVTGQPPIRNIKISSYDQVAKALGIDSALGIVSADHIDMQARVNVVDSNVTAYFYLNEVLMNKEPITIGIDRRIVHLGGTGKVENNMIGFSTYGEGTSVTVRKLYMEPWDGVTTEYSAYPIEDNEYNGAVKKCVDEL